MEELGINAYDADHPRTCGANEPCRSWAAPCGGSSPHMRGKLLSGGLSGALNRIIPAHAGQTAAAHHCHHHCADHPRTCGANAGMVLGMIIASGSSPHMRGKLSDAPNNLRLDWIIPAHAGQTPTCSASICAATDHPRTCGANVHGDVAGLQLVGSSPHMRGKRMVCRSR